MYITVIVDDYSIYGLRLGLIWWFTFYLFISFFTDWIPLFICWILLLYWIPLCCWLKLLFLLPLFLYGFPLWLFSLLFPIFLEYLPIYVILLFWESIWGILCTSPKPIWEFWLFCVYLCDLLLVFMTLVTEWWLNISSWNINLDFCCFKWLPLFIVLVPDILVEFELLLRLLLLLYLLLLWVYWLLLWVYLLLS